MNDEPLKPCPNLECKSANVESYRFMQVASGKDVYVRCLDCGMHGPILHRKLAAANWNSFPRAED